MANENNFDALTNHLQVTLRRIETEILPSSRIAKAKTATLLAKSILMTHEVAGGSPPPIHELKGLLLRAELQIAKVNEKLVVLQNS